jgi:DNA-binding HxlR family transcriptional regulator
MSFRKQYNCPAEMTVGLIGGKWRIVALWLLRKGPQRSGKLKSRMPGISPAAFSLAVRDLEAAGLVRRIVKSVEPPQVSYALTSRGESLKPILRSLVKWGLAHQKSYALGDFGMAQFYRPLKSG